MYSKRLFHIYATLYFLALLTFAVLYYIHAYSDDDARRKRGIVRQQKRAVRRVSTLLFSCCQKSKQRLVSSVAGKCTQHKIKRASLCRCHNRTRRRVAATEARDVDLQCDFIRNLPSRCPVSNDFRQRIVVVVLNGFATRRHNGGLRLAN